MHPSRPLYLLISIVLFCALGCAAQPSVQTKPAQHPIIGTWVLNVQATGPAEARGVESTLVFSPDGNYNSTAKAGPDKPQVMGDGTFRTDGEDVYLDTGSGPQKLLYKVEGNRLILHDPHDPGAMIFDRKLN